MVKSANKPTTNPKKSTNYGRNTSSKIISNRENGNFNTIQQSLSNKEDNDREQDMSEYEDKDDDEYDADNNDEDENDTEDDEICNKKNITRIEDIQLLRENAIKYGIKGKRLSKKKLINSFEDKDIIKTRQGKKYKREDIILKHKDSIIPKFIDYKQFLTIYGENFYKNIYKLFIYNENDTKKAYKSLQYSPLNHRDTLYIYKKNNTTISQKIAIQKILNSTTISTFNEYYNNTDDGDMNSDCWLIFPKTTPSQIIAKCCVVDAYTQDHMTYTIFSNLLNQSSSRIYTQLLTPTQIKSKKSIDVFSTYFSYRAETITLGIIFFIKYILNISKPTLIGTSISLKKITKHFKDHWDEAIYERSILINDKNKLESISKIFILPIDILIKWFTLQLSPDRFIFVDTIIRWRVLCYISDNNIPVQNALFFLREFPQSFYKYSLLKKYTQYKGSSVFFSPYSNILCNIFIYPNNFLYTILPFTPNSIEKSTISYYDWSLYISEVSIDSIDDRDTVVAIDSSNNIPIKDTNISYRKSIIDIIKNINTNTNIVTNTNTNTIETIHKRCTTIFNKQDKKYINITKNTKLITNEIQSQKISSHQCNLQGSIININKWISHTSKISTDIPISILNVGNTVVDIAWSPRWIYNTQEYQYLAVCTRYTVLQYIDTISILSNNNSKNKEYYLQLWDCTIVPPILQYIIPLIDSNTPTCFSWISYEKNPAGIILIGFSDGTIRILILPPFTNKILDNIIELDIVQFPQNKIICPIGHIPQKITGISSIHEDIIKILIGTVTGTILVWDLTYNQIIGKDTTPKQASFIGQAGTIYGIAPSPITALKIQYISINNKYLILVGSWNGYIHSFIIPSSTHIPINSLYISSKSIRTISIIPDTSLIIIPSITIIYIVNICPITGEMLYIHTFPMKPLTKYPKILGMCVEILFTYYMFIYYLFICSFTGPIIVDCDCYYSEKYQYQLLFITSDGNIQTIYFTSSNITTKVADISIKANGIETYHICTLYSDTKDFTTITFPKLPKVSNKRKNKTQTITYTQNTDFMNWQHLSSCAINQISNTFQFVVASTSGLLQLYG